MNVYILEIYSCKSNHYGTNELFKQVEDLQLTGDLHITIRWATAGQWVVSTLLTNEACTDEAKKLIPPYTLKGTAEELDKGFFEAISTPLQVVAGLVADIWRLISSNWRW